MSEVSPMQDAELRERRAKTSGRRNSAALNQSAFSDEEMTTRIYLICGG
jgi:hypothetical protein